MDDLLFALTLIFVLAAVLLVAVARLSVPVIPFYLLTGILAGVIIDETQLLDLAQWGIAFLVFLFGVHVDLNALRATGRMSAIVALVQAALVSALVILAGVGLGLPLLEAVFLGITAALSSSLIATSYLDRARGMRPAYRRLAESIHFTEDLLGIAIVVALSVVVYTTGPPWQPLASAGLLLGGALAIRHLVFHRLTARLQGDPEVMMLVGISLVIGGIAIAEVTSMSIIVGAFAAGIAVADAYPHSLELVDTIDDLEEFFMPIFFITLGALLAIPTLETIGYTLILVITVLVLNPLLVAVLLLWRGMHPRTAILTGLSLDQVSAFSLFIAIEALAGGFLRRPIFDAIVLAAVLTMLVATYSTRHADAIYRAIQGTQMLSRIRRSDNTRVPVDDTLEDHVVIVGFAFGGSEILDICADLDRPVVVIEDDPFQIEEVRDRCQHYVYGEIEHQETWSAARVPEAALIVSLVPDADRAGVVATHPSDVPRLVRVDAPIADAWLEYEQLGVLSPDAIGADHVRRDLIALCNDEISIEEFRRVGDPARD